MKRGKRLGRKWERKHPLVGKWVFGYWNTRSLGAAWRLVQVRAVSKGDLRVTHVYGEFKVPREQLHSVRWRGKMVPVAEWLAQHGKECVS